MCQYFYMRISTKEKAEDDKRKDQEQTFERQKGILERAGYVLNDENTFADRISGKTSAEERERYEAMLGKLEEGDWVIFTESSRFSRSYIAGMQMLDTLIFDKKVNVRFVSNGIELLANGKYNPYTWFSISQMLLADELQRRVISYNTANGLQRRRDLGVQLGRPKSIDEESRRKVLELKEQGLAYKDIQKETGISPATICRIIKDGAK